MNSAGVGALSPKRRSILAATVPLAVVIAMGLLVFEIVRLRRALEKLQPISSPSQRVSSSQRSRLVALPGDVVDVVLASAEGQRTDLKSIAADGPTYVWLFDPGCSVCEIEADEISSMASLPDRPRIVAISKGSKVPTQHFLENHKLSIPTFLYLGEVREARLRAVPQLFQVDSNGKVRSVARCPCEIRAGNGIDRSAEVSARRSSPPCS